MWERLGLALILAALAGALIFQAWHTGVTVDEPAHLLSARLYWEGDDRLAPRDVPPGIKIAGGWVPKQLGLPVPRDHPAWSTRDGWLLALLMMERMNAAQIRRIFFLARIPLLVFPLLTAFLLWRWAMQLDGGRTAVLLTLAFALEPTVLGHQALFKNDLAATCGYLLFWYRAWRYWHAPGPANAALLGGALLVALLAKLSMSVLIPSTPVIVGLRALSRRPRRLRQALTGTLLVLAIPYFGALAASQFEARRLAGEELE